MISYATPISTEFGSITIDNKKYSQVLILGETIEEREYDRLKELFGTSHRIGPWEEVVTHKTPEALEDYNRLATEGKRVSGLFHTTC